MKYVDNTVDTVNSAACRVFAFVASFLICGDAYSKISDITGNVVDEGAEVTSDVYRIVCYLAIAVAAFTVWSIYTFKKENKDRGLEPGHKWGLIMPILMFGLSIILGGGFESVFGTTTDVSIDGIKSGSGF